MKTKIIIKSVLVLALFSLASCSSNKSIASDAAMDQIEQINAQYFNLKKSGLSHITFQCNSNLFDRLSANVQDQSIKKSLKDVSFQLEWNVDGPMKIKTLGIPDASEIENKEGFYKTINGVKGMITSAVEGASFVFNDFIKPSEGIVIKNDTSGSERKWIIDDPAKKTRTEAIVDSADVILRSDLYVSGKLVSQAKFTVFKKDGLYYLDHIEFLTPSNPSQLGNLKVKYKKFNDVEIPSEIHVRYTQNGITTAEDTITLALTQEALTAP